MSNVGVFTWIRDNVRRAVLLGFSDAVEQLGGPDDKDALHPQLQALLRDTPRKMTGENRPVEPISARGERKRLGRSLGQSQASGGASAALDG